MEARRVADDYALVAPTSSRQCIDIRICSRWYPITVKKTSVYLDPDLDRALGRLAADERRSKASLIREAIAQRLGNAAGQPRMTSVGTGAGPGNVASDVDRHLDGSGFGET